MKRINLIIGKKQIIIVGLTLILGVAVYINYMVGSTAVRDEPVSGEAANYGDEIFVTSAVVENTEGANGEPVSAAPKDEAIGVNASADEAPAEADNETDAYFAQARLDREESRAEAIEVLQNLYSGGDSTETELAVIAQDAQKMSGYIESETKIESVLKAQGFEDVLCYLSENGASIIVKTAGLDTAQAAQIKSALLSEVKIPAENITIVEIK